MTTYDLCSWCDGDGDDGCGWHCLHCSGDGMVEIGDDDFDDFEDFSDEEAPSAACGGSRQGALK